MNNEKLHRDQKGENQQYINTNPSWETRLPWQESRGLWPIQKWEKKREMSLERSTQDSTITLRDPEDQVQVGQTNAKTGASA